MIAGDFIKIVGMTIILTLIVSVTSWIITIPAKGEQVCLTRSQAHELFKRRHLYWYRGEDGRCWSNRRGPPRGVNVNNIPGIKSDPLKTHAEEKATDANGNLAMLDAGTSRIEDSTEKAKNPSPTVFYPALNMRGSVPPEMLKAYAMTQWPLLIDEEDQGIGLTKDGCCWPKLDTLVDWRLSPLHNHIGAPK